LMLLFVLLNVVHQLIVEKGSLRRRHH
jgi:hypothetical protein